MLASPRLPAPPHQNRGGAGFRAFPFPSLATKPTLAQAMPPQAGPLPASFQPRTTHRLATRHLAASCPCQMQSAMGLHRACSCIRTSIYLLLHVRMTRCRHLRPVGALLSPPQRKPGGSCVSSCPAMWHGLSPSSRRRQICQLDDAKQCEPAASSPSLPSDSLCRVEPPPKGARYRHLSDERLSCLECWLC